MTDEQQGPPRQQARSGRTVGNAVAKTEGVDEIVGWVADDRAVYGQVLPSHIEQVHWVRLATGLLRRDPALAAAAMKNPDSLKYALLECARLGHEPGTDAFALVPFNNKDARNGVEIVGIEQYQGEIERMFRAGGVTSVVCEIVYSEDIFTWTPGEAPQHDADWFGGTTRGEMIGVYAFARLTGGAVSNVVMMGVDEINKHKAVAKTKAMWDKWPKSMWKKTAIHELEKWVPTSAEYQRERLRALSEAQQARVDVAPTTTTYKAERVDTTTGEIVTGEVR